MQKLPMQGTSDGIGWVKIEDKELVNFHTYHQAHRNMKEHWLVEHEYR